MPNRRTCAGLLLLSAMAPAAWASNSEADAIIVTAPGGEVDADDALTLTGQGIGRAGTADLLQGLTRNMAGVTLQDAQNNPWQPNLIHRGFIASPLQGQAQGLAAYLDGARFNQPFGDTVQFDLLPEAAISRISLLDASPVYGLNALGGAVVIETKAGRSDPGLLLSATGGRFGYAEAAVEAGIADGAYSAFIALQQSHDGGWRNFSPSTLYNGYADFGFDGAAAGLHLKLVGADSDLTGNGVSPVELLAADRRAVFTHPDNTRNDYGRASLHPWLALSPSTRVEATLYLQYLRQRTLNGDAADIEACEEAEHESFLCLETVGDGEGEEVLLTDAAGTPFADVSGGRYGVLNRSQTRTSSGGMLVQLIDERSLLAGNNRLALGFSHDWSRTHFRTSTELGKLTETRSVDGLGGIIVQADGAIAPVDLVAKTRYSGLFLANRVPLASGLSAEIGLRWNHARIVLEDQIGTALNGRHRFHRLNPGVEFDYELSKALQLRLGYAESNRAPTAAELSCADADAPCSLTNFFVADPPLKQVVGKSWEAGASGSVSSGEWKVQWLLSAYRSTNHNDIQYVASEIRGRAYFRNIGSTRRQGVETALTAQHGGFEARLSYAFTDATYRSPLVLFSPAHPLAGEDGTIEVAKGDRLPGIARHSVALALGYGEKGWTAGMDLIVRSGQYLSGDEANLDTKLPGYAIVNLHGSVDLKPGLSLFGELRNAFNRRYATFGTYTEVEELELEEAPGASNPRAYGPGAARRWLLGLRARF